MKPLRVLPLLLVLLSSPAAVPGGEIPSGLDIGAEAPAFDPQHVAGEDKGSHACPMCKYGKLQGVLLWVNSDDLGNVGKIASRLEQEIRELGPKRVRVFMIYMNPDRKPRPELEALLSSWAADASLKHVAVTYVPSPTDEKSSVLYRINPDPRVKNTVFVYRKRRIVDKFVNLHADDDSLARLVRSVESAAASG